MGIVVHGPAYIFDDKKYVICITTIPYSTLKNKSQSIDYHIVLEEATRYEWRTAYVNMHENISDLLKKMLPMSDKRQVFSI